MTPFVDSINYTAFGILIGRGIPELYICACVDLIALYDYFCISGFAIFNLFEEIMKYVVEFEKKTEIK